MTLATFPSTVHTPRHTYPPGDQQKFGKGYQYAVKPLLPLQRTFILSFDAMQWDGPVAGYDMQTLIDFYEAHELWDRFNYVHPKYGTLIVRFATPLAVPKSVKGGSGATEPFEVQLIEQPL
jgi:hypothetical protein